MPLTLISHDFLRETIHNEIPLAEGFDDLSKAMVDIAFCCRFMTAGIHLS